MVIPDRFALLETYTASEIPLLETTSLTGTEHALRWYLIAPNT
jgi:hypothetical protein